MHPAKWSFKNVIRHHNRCQLVHPAKGDILTMSYTIMTDADWCIPLCGTLTNFGCLHERCQLVHLAMLVVRYIDSIQDVKNDQFVYNSINHSYAINCQTFQISHFQIHMHFRNIISRIYSFQVYLIITKHLKYEYNFNEQRTNNT